MKTGTKTSTHCLNSSIKDVKLRLNLSRIESIFPPMGPMSNPLTAPVLISKSPPLNSLRAVATKSSVPLMRDLVVRKEENFRS